MQARTMWLGFKSEAPMRCGELAVVEQVLHRETDRPQIPFDYWTPAGCIIPATIAECFDIEGVTVDGKEQLFLFQRRDGTLTRLDGMMFEPEARVRLFNFDHVPYDSKIAIRVRRNEKRPDSAITFRLSLTGEIHSTPEQQAQLDAYRAVCEAARNEIACQPVVLPHVPTGWICHRCVSWNAPAAVKCTSCEHVCCIGLAPTRAIGSDVKVRLQNARPMLPGEIGLIRLRLDDKDLPPFEPTEFYVTEKTAPKFVIHQIIFDHETQISMSDALPAEAITPRSKYLGISVKFGPITRDAMIIVQNISSIDTNIEIDIVGKVLSKEAVVAHRLGVK